MNENNIPNKLKRIIKRDKYYPIVGLLMLALFFFLIGLSQYYCTVSCSRTINYRDEFIATGIILVISLMYFIKVYNK
jgi:hypothetical protein